MGSTIDLELLGGVHRVSTHGLSFLNHPELEMRTTDDGPALARSILAALAAQVVGAGVQLQPGDSFAIGDHRVRLELGGAGHLAVVHIGSEWLRPGAA